MLEAYIYDGIRTPIGRHAGALSSIRPDDLLAENIKYLLQRTKNKLIILRRITSREKLNRLILG